MTVSQPDDNLFWYVIHTHPRQEERAEGNLSAWNVETFAPKMKKRRYNQFTGLPQETVIPLFPSYIFARFNLDALLHMVRYTRGVHSVVSFGDKPISVDEQIVSIIRSRIGKDGLVRLDEDMEPGDKVVVRDGMLRNFEGVFEHGIRDTDRVKILLNTVSFQAHIVVESQQVRKIS